MNTLEVGPEPAPVFLTRLWRYGHTLDQIFLSLNLSDGTL